MIYFSNLLITCQFKWGCFTSFAVKITSVKFLIIPAAVNILSGFSLVNHTKKATNSPKLTLLVGWSLLIHFN
jgi:hypothetical protein